MIAQIIRAVLFAIATVATLVGFRASRSASIDWSFEREKVEKFMVDNPHLSVEDAALAIAYEYGSIVSYSEVLPDKLRVFCNGDTPTNPLGWKMLTQVSNNYIARQK